MTPEERAKHIVELLTDYRDQMHLAKVELQITSAIKTAAEEALEDAAKVCDERADLHSEHERQLCEKGFMAPAQVRYEMMAEAKACAEAIRNRGK